MDLDNQEDAKRTLALLSGEREKRPTPPADVLRQRENNNINWGKALWRAFEALGIIAGIVATIWLVFGL